MNDTYYIDPKTQVLTIDKDPDELLDYPFDWTEFLDEVSDTIATAGPGIVPVLFTVTGATLDSQQNSAKVATAWVKGGTAGTTAKVSCRITTTGGRIAERSINLKIRER